MQRLVSFQCDNEEFSNDDVKEETSINQYIIKKYMINCAIIIGLLIKLQIQQRLDNSHIQNNRRKVSNKNPISFQ